MRPFSLPVPVVVQIYHGRGGDPRRPLWRGPLEEADKSHPESQSMRGRRQDRYAELSPY